MLDKHDTSLAMGWAIHLSYKDCEVSLSFHRGIFNIASLQVKHLMLLQVIGMHFMNPPPIMKLVEIVRGADTSNETFDAIKILAERWFSLHWLLSNSPLSPLHHQLSFLVAWDYFTWKTFFTFRLGKTVICSQDYSGFIVNRILMPMINEAFFALFTGVATKEDIDTGMKLGTNHPMGPLELADFIGLDVCLSIMKVLHSGLGDNKYAPCPLLVQYVDAGRLGRKRGIGVYDYRKLPQSEKSKSRLWTINGNL